MLQLARPEDKEAVEAIAQQVHAMHIAWRPDIYESTQELYSEDRFQNAIKERQLYVAKIEKVVVGYLLLKIRNYDWIGVVNRRVMLIDEIAVHESCQNQGIGKQMMEDARALAYAFGCTDLQLSVYPQNDDAVAFYQKCGFTIQNISMQRKV